MPEEDRVPLLRQAIEKGLLDKGFTKEALAKKLDVSASWVSKLLSGQALGKTLLNVQRLRTTEEFLGLEAGTLLRRLAFEAERRISAEDLARPRLLPPDLTNALLVVVEHLEHSGVEMAPRPRRGATRAGSVAHGRAAKSGKAGASKSAKKETAARIEERKPPTPPSTGRPRRS